MRGVDHLHKSGRVLAQGQIIGARQTSPPFYQKLRQHSGFVERLFKYEENHEVSMLYSLSVCIKRL